MPLTKEEKSKWDSCLHMDMISSEESEHEMDEDGRKITKFIVHPIPWRSTKQSERSEMMTIKDPWKTIFANMPQRKYPAFMIKS